MLLVAVVYAVVVVLFLTSEMFTVGLKYCQSWTLLLFQYF